ncbi:MAG: hypothetical protein EXR71_10715 [Myxococcales bacterium]|nr:hypothetical protein [Myxococcales bacterium]
MSEGATELLPAHVSADFYLWLWFKSESLGGHFSIEDGTALEVYVDDRLALRDAGEERPTTLLTGDSPGTTPEARAAVLGGKVPKEIRFLMRREDREYHVTLRGERVGIAGAKLPTQVKTGEVAEILYDRMFVYEELHWLVSCLLRQFAAERASAAWRLTVVPQMRAWLGALDAGASGG